MSLELKQSDGFQHAHCTEHQDCGNCMHPSSSKGDERVTSHCRRIPLSIPDSQQNSKSEIERHIQEMCARIKSFLPKIIGFPGNFEPRQEMLDDVMGITINNQGDPYIGDHDGLNTKRFELGVLEWFAALWEISLDESWGYITNGGTEANLQALYVAREKLPNGIVYTSSESHYSVTKAARILRMQIEEIRCLEHGEMDYDALKEKLVENAGVPAIINANIGTTMTGAIDDVDKITQILNDTGHTEDDFFIHCDAALLGIMLPFLQTPCSLTFKKPIDSIIMSGHKFLGSPYPSGIFMTRRKYKDLEGMQCYIQYVDRVDNTISGSRNGHSAVQMWYALAKRGTDGVREVRSEEPPALDVLNDTSKIPLLEAHCTHQVLMWMQETLECVRKARILHDMLQKAEIDSKLLDYSNTVYFPRPKSLDSLDWILASTKSMSHVITMQDVSIKDIEKFVSDLVRCM